MTSQLRRRREGRERSGERKGGKHQEQRRKDSLVLSNFSPREREQIKTSWELGFRRGRPRRKTRFLSLLLITSAHLASLPVALPPRRYLATGSSTFERLSRGCWGSFFFFYLSLSLFFLSSFAYLFGCLLPSLPPSFPSRSLIPLTRDLATAAAATAQTFHRRCRASRISRGGRGKNKRLGRCSGLKYAKSAGGGTSGSYCDSGRMPATVRAGAHPSSARASHEAACDKPI